MSKKISIKQYDWKKELLEAFSPLGKISGKTSTILVLMTIFSIAFFWQVVHIPFFPSPERAWKGFVHLWTKWDFLGEIITSASLNLLAVVFTLIIGLGIAYSTVIPAFRPLNASFATSLRFLSFGGMTLLISGISANQYFIRMFLLVFSMGVFYVTGMVGIIASIPKKEYDHCRVTGYGRWRTVWEVIILGRRAEAWELLKQNFAIGWMMLLTVENYSRSLGGVGVLMYSQEKFLKLENLYAIQITILLLGIFLDYLFGVAKKFIAPYNAIDLERK